MGTELEAQRRIVEKGTTEKRIKNAWKMNAKMEAFYNN